MEPILMASAAIVACLVYRAVVDAVHDLKKDRTAGFLLSNFIIVCSRFRRHFPAADVTDWRLCKAPYHYRPHRHSMLNGRKTEPKWEFLGRSGGRW